MNDQPLAYEDDEFLDSDRGAADPHPRRIPRSAAPVQGAEHPGHGRVLRVGAGAQPHARPAEPARAERTTIAADTADYDAALKRSRKALEWSRYYEDARELANC